MDIYCRICSRSDDFEKVCLTTVSQISDVRIDDMLVYSTQLEVSTKDSLPQQICMECMAALDSTFLFRKQCYRSDTTFREMLKNTTFEPTSPHLPNIPPQDSFTHDNLSETTIKEEVKELDESIDSMDETECYESTTDIYKNNKRARQEIKIHVCNNCGYATELSANMKRHRSKPLNCELRRIRTSRPKGSKLIRLEKKNLLRRIKDNWELDDFLNSTMDEYNEIPATNANVKDTSGDTDKKTNDVQKKINFHVCTDCGYKTAIPAYFQRHKNMSQNCKREKYRVMIRREFYNKMRTLSNSSKMRGKTIYFCEECGYNTCLISNFIRHQKSFQHHPAEDVVDQHRVIYVCKECGYSIHKKTDFTEHQQTQLHSQFGILVVQTRHQGRKKRKQKSISNKEDNSKLGITDPDANHIDCLKEEISIEESKPVSQNPITDIDT